MALRDFLDLYTEENRPKFLLAAAATVAVIAVVDRISPTGIGLSFLYGIAFVLAAAYLKPSQIVLFAVMCACLREYQNPVEDFRWITRFIFFTTGFAFTGLVVRELARSRQIAVENLKLIQQEVQRRQDAEEQVRIVIESSPAAIVVIGSGGTVLMANAAARRLFDFEEEPLEGESIWPYLPVLETIQLRNDSSKFLKVNLDTRARRKNSEPFPANLWVSTYRTHSEARLAAIILDSSESLRDWEQSGLDQLMSNSQILMAAVSHEVRNLCGAINVVHMNLTRLPGLSANEDFSALRHLIEGLREIASAELLPANRESTPTLPLGEVLDDLRVVMEPQSRELGIPIEWQIPPDALVVRAEHHGLLQVLLNLVQNSCRAMEGRLEGVLKIAVSRDGRKVRIRVVDTGPGVAHPERLFQPFQLGADVTGLGLYVSRAIIRAYGGNLSYEKQDRGACFVVELPSVSTAENTRDTAEVFAQQTI
jgi:PAS domain S-box-containing protein